MALGDGKVATCYLGKQQRQALDQAVEHTGWLHSHYVRIAILEKLAVDGYVSRAVVDAEKEKADFRRENPHGNSKRAKAAHMPESKEMHSGAGVPVPERKARLIARREARRARRNG